MASDRKDSTPTLANDGWVPAERGWRPAFQGGYQPATSKIAASPPTGGSGVKVPPLKK